MKLLFIGNFEPAFSTENDLKWTFEKLGWEVFTVQENARLTEVIPVAEMDMVLWVHTHGWDQNLRFISRIILHSKERGIPTVGFHLDRYFGLEVLDKRESRIGQHLWWKMDHIFTADGDHQEEFKQRRVNHHYLKPGVVERDCFIGKPYKDQVDIGFVGSRSYHPEYKEREQLIDWLHETYGNRFARFAGDCASGTVRGDELNNLYASVKVFVGDSCFANRIGGVKHYWSDRIPETTGRGGFLIHPHVEGLDHPGVATFEPGNYLELRELIDYFVDQVDSREILRQRGHEWTKENATYTNRVQEMLEVVGK